MVSVITSCYNSAAYIEQCIKSVQAINTHDRFRVEHIVVDDGSTDASPVILQDLACSFKGSNISLKVYGLAVNTGMPSQVRNYGIGRAGGKYLFCLDADDVITQNALRYFLDHFMANPDSRWAYADFLRSGKTLNYDVGHDYWGWSHATPSDLLYSVFKGDHIYQHSFMCERALFNEVGGYDADSRFGEDLDLCARYVMAGFMPTHLPITSHIHRNHGANMAAHFDHAEHLKDVRNHYAAHKVALVQWLTPKQIVEVEQSIEWDRHPNDAPGQRADNDTALSSLANSRISQVPRSALKGVHQHARWPDNASMAALALTVSASVEPSQSRRPS